MIKLTCNRCNRVSFGVSRAYAEQEVIAFNKYFDSLTEDEQQRFYGGKGSSIDFYEECIHCGNSHTDFRAFKDGDCPDGCTLNPIITE